MVAIDEVNPTSQYAVSAVGCECCVYYLPDGLLVTLVHDVERCLAMIFVTDGYLASDDIGQGIDEY